MYAVELWIEGIDRGFRLFFHSREDATAAAHGIVASTQRGTAGASYVDALGNELLFQHSRLRLVRVTDSEIA